MKRLFLLIIFMSWAGVVLADESLQLLDDGALSDVTGQEGVAVDLELRLNTDSAGAPLASLSSCTGTSNPCHMAIQFNNRLGGSGEWLVLKDIYGKLNISNLFLDEADLSATSTYLDISRFKDKAGVCLITSCNPNGLPALAMSFPGALGTFEADINLYLNIGRVAVEYGAAGYNADANGSFLGLKISDVRAGQIQAQADVDGKVRMYGF
jgi:hypothetical protein